jgi:hypothetical protein
MRSAPSIRVCFERWAHLHANIKQRIEWCASFHCVASKVRGTSLFIHFQSSPPLRSVKGVSPEAARVHKDVPPRRGDTYNFLSEALSDASH